MWRAILFVLFFSFLLPVHGQKRVIMLGFDGLDHAMVQQWMAEEKLPNMKALAKQGDFRALQSSNPAQSPVAWSTAITGTNPGKHGIFDFLRRSENGYHPKLGLGEIELWTISGPWINFFVAILASYLFWLSLNYTPNIWGKNKEHHKKYKLYTIISIAFGIALPIWIGMHYFIPKQIPFPKSLRHGETIWQVASKHDLHAIVLDAPMAFPAESFSQGMLFCGLGVPDVAGTNGIWYRYSTTYTSQSTTETGGRKIPLQKSALGYSAPIYGPKDLIAAEEITDILEQLQKTDSPMTIRTLRNRLTEIQKYTYRNMTVIPTGDSDVHIQIGANSYTIANGQWSPWISIVFRVNYFIRMSGIFKMRVLRVNPPELYVSPVQFHPTKTPYNVSIATPYRFPQEIVAQNGIYPTLGWSEANNALKDEEIPEEVFWEDMQDTFIQRKKIFWQQFHTKDWQLLLAFFYTPDRASHMYWPKAKNTPKRVDALLQVYQDCDRLVGEVLSQIHPEDCLLVLSDHGFAAFDYEVNLNTWLYENGYLVLIDETDFDKRAQIQDLYEHDALGKHINWDKTRAYAMGLGGIYLNIRGRDPKGIIEPGSNATQLAFEIREKLKLLQHENTHVITSAFLQEELYNGPYTMYAPDIIVGFQRGYRIAWQSTLGVVSNEIISPNTLCWVGDHCSVDPELIPGIILSNQKVFSTKPHLVDIAPTIFQYLGIPIPQNLDGKSLFQPN